MKDRKYVVCRDNIYVGELIECFEIFEREKDNSLMVGSYNSLRSMLFILDENNLASDLIYNSPNYPIVNISSIDEVKSNEMLIQNICNLGELLEYFGYDKELTYKDILTIRNVFFKHGFAYRYSDLFGYKKQIDKERKCIGYVKTSKSILNSKYFSVLSKRSDDLIGYLVDEGKIDAFRPHEAEGKIKKLKKCRH